MTLPFVIITCCNREPLRFLYTRYKRKILSLYGFNNNNNNISLMFSNIYVNEILFPFTAAWWVGS